MRPSKRFLEIGSIATLVVLCALGAAGLDQTGSVPGMPESATQPQGTRTTDDQRGAWAERRDIDDPENLRSRIEAAIERGESTLARQREALALLDAGESPAEAMRSLRGRVDTRSDRPPRGRPGPRTEENHQQSADREEPSLEELQEIVRQHFPVLSAQIDSITDENPEFAGRLFLRMSPRIRQIALDMRHDPDLAQLRIQEVHAGLAIGDASRQWRQASATGEPTSTESASAALRDAIGAQFDAKIALRQHEVERLVGRIGELNQEILNEMSEKPSEVERVYRSIVNRTRPSRRP